MRTKIGTWVLLVALASFPASSATMYIVYFQTNQGPAPSPATFSWDGSTFSNFFVTWNGKTYDMTSSANAPTITVDNGCPGQGATPAYGFAIMTQTCVGATYGWSASSFPFVSFFTFSESGNTIFGFGAPGATVSASGTWNTVELPEPGTIAMIGIGGVLLGSMRVVRRQRRKTAETAQASLDLGPSHPAG